MTAPCSDARCLANIPGTPLYLPIRRFKTGHQRVPAPRTRNFYEHGGIDFTGMARAAVLFAQNYGSNAAAGASTINPAVAKNFF